MKEIKDFAECAHTLLYLRTFSYRQSNKNISERRKKKVGDTVVV